MAPSSADPDAERRTCGTCGRWHRVGTCMDEWTAIVKLVTSAEATAIKRAQRGDLDD